MSLQMNNPCPYIWDQSRRWWRHTCNFLHQNRL